MSMAEEKHAPIRPAIRDGHVLTMAMPPSESLPIQRSQVTTVRRLTRGVCRRVVQRKTGRLLALFFILIALICCLAPAGSSFHAICGPGQGGLAFICTSFKHTPHANG